MASHPSFPHPRRLHPKNDAGADQAATGDSQIAARCQISIAVQQQDAILVTKRAVGLLGPKMWRCHFPGVYQSWNQCASQSGWDSLPSSACLEPCFKASKHLGFDWKKLGRATEIMIVGHWAPQIIWKVCGQQSHKEHHMFACLEATWTPSSELPGVWGKHFFQPWNP